MDQFTLTIELGNAAMQSPGDIVYALEEVAEELRANMDTDAWHTCEGRLRDENGNTVGRWSVV